MLSPTEDHVRKYFKRFEIRGLHGSRDVSVEFGRSATIIVGENGTGKTTTLNALYAILTGRIEKLRGLRFKEIVLTPTKGRQIKVTSEDLEECFSAPHRRSRASELALRDIFRFLDPASRRWAERTLTTRGPKYLISHPRFTDAFDDSTYSRGELFHLLRRVEKGPNQLDKKTTELRGRLKEVFPFEVLYFPTYRRVEEDLHQLGYSDEIVSRGEQLIHFGMTDVSQRFDRVAEALRASAAEWYVTISGKMLSELIGGIEVSPEEYALIRDKEALGIVLERVGGGIDAEQRAKILSIVQSGRIKGEQYRALAYFLSKLVSIYDQQRGQDARIKQFAEVANQYLVQKQVVYNERTVSIHVVDNITRVPVKLGKLSSGEKQMISLFSRLYLSDASQYCIIIDEPELSLSMEWQRTLLPDILDSGRTALLVAATHSPFIFENELDSDATPLRVKRFPTEPNVQTDSVNGPDDFEEDDE